VTWPHRLAPCSDSFIRRTARDKKLVGYKLQTGLVGIKNVNCIRRRLS
jgi:hypothetical protein